MTHRPPSFPRVFPHRQAGLPEKAEFETSQATARAARLKGAS
jgi:hypothetical protein